MQLDPGWTYQLQATVDFTNWSVITTITLTTNIVTYIDPSSGFPHRF
jgi:hypothetical protein